MTSNVKRKSMALVMALLLCFSMFVSFGTTVQAAGEHSEIYMVSFPRDAESNRDHWDRDSLQFMNGWYMDAYDMFATFAVGSYEGIISLQREDAERLGFDNGSRWRDMLRTQTQALSENLRIPMGHLKWFAAFHNESHHPHVHLIAYSTVESEGHLTKQGVQKLLSSFAKHIFAQDLLCIYEKQTEHRNRLRSESRDVLAEIGAQINAGRYSDPHLDELLLRLTRRLSRTKGKKVYGYLKADVKAIIDSIVDEIAKDNRISSLYDLWYKQRENVLRTYNSSLPERIPLSQNKEFKAIKNAIVQAAMDLVLDSQQEQSTAEDDVEITHGHSLSPFPHTCVADSLY